MIDRRTFLCGLILGELAMPLAVEAQPAETPKVAKIGFLFGATLLSPSIEIAPFKQALTEKGWSEGQNFTLEYRLAEGRYERLPTLARELVDLGVDVIVTDSTPATRAAMNVTKTVSIVMATTGDPVGAGLVRSLARPGGNVTGASFFFPEVQAKRLELLKEAAPEITRVAVIYNALNPVHEPAVVAIETAAKQLKVQTERLPVRASADFDSVFPMMTRQRMDAVTVLEDPMINLQSLRVIDVALKGRVLAVFGHARTVAAGGFMSYAPNRPDMWRRAALVTDKILKGAKPADLPIEQATKFELVINRASRES